MKNAIPVFMNPTTATTVKIAIPSILSANCYFWKPAGHASNRRANEVRKNKEVFDFFLLLGFFCHEGNFRKDEIVVEFSYRESCKNVYKSFTVEISGKKSNIVGLKREMRELGVELV